jgi:hypothetical protein
MNNMQTTTPGFVLTSLSFRQTDKKKTIQEPVNSRSQSSIAKFDYCLPPDDFTNTEITGNRQSA